MPQHIFPLRRNPTPPNIFFSVSPLRRPRALRIRSANRSSNAMGGVLGKRLRRLTVCFTRSRSRAKRVGCKRLLAGVPLWLGRENLHTEAFRQNCAIRLPSFEFLLWFFICKAPPWVAFHKCNSTTTGGASSSRVLGARAP